METSFKKFYDNDDIKKGLFQVPFLDAICDSLITEMMQWLGDEKARIAFSKDPDLFIYDKNNFILWKAMKKLHSLMRNQNLVPEIFYKTEKHLSYNNLQSENAYEFWIIDVDNNNDPYVTRVASNDVLQKSKVINCYIEIQVRKDILEINNSKFEIIETRNEDYIETNIMDVTKNKILAKEEIPKEILEKYEPKLGKVEWPYGFVPFVYLPNNPDCYGDIFYIQSELNELLAVRGQKMIELFLASTKIASTEELNQNYDKQEDVNSRFTDILKVFSSPVITSSNSLMPGSSTGPGIVYGQPTVEPYERLEKSIKNRILQKVGAAMDVDAKGTVQQSGNEIVMMQGNQYRLLQWKNNDRQQRIQELFTKLALIYLQNGDEDFKGFKKLRVILSQDEVVSEEQMLKNLQLAKNDGLTSQVISYARYNKLNILEAYDLLRLKELAPNVESKELKEGEEDAETN